jgi:hypothetical protein
MTPEERRDLVREADRRAADQFPRAGDPDQEADDHQDRDSVHRAGVTWLGDHDGSLGHLQQEHDDQPEQEHHITQPLPHLARPDQRQQRCHHEQDPPHSHHQRRWPDLVAGDQREQ